MSQNELQCRRLNDPLLASVTDSVYEIKTHMYRIFVFHESCPALPTNLVITHYIKKQRQRLDATELRRVRSVWHDYHDFLERSRVNRADQLNLKALT